MENGAWYVSKDWMCDLKTVGLVIWLAASFAAGAQPLLREAVLAETLKPYTGPSVRGVDAATLSNKVMCGYQGWFNAEGDGADRGWVHWTKGNGRLAPGNAKFDLWPDVSELGPDERFATGFKHADGSVAEVFSSFKRATVLRHFQWMHDYGIDGAFVQRFAVGTGDPHSLRQNNVVLDACREGANRNGRTYAVMYDLSGLSSGRISRVMDDWKLLRTRMKIADDPAYLHHRGKPVVVVWGIGFSDGRKYTLDECRHLIEFLKNDPEAGGCTVMVGVPTYWRELKRDAVGDPQLHEIIKLADIVSPWSVGRYKSPDEAIRHAEEVMKPDLAWCRERGLDCLPVVFPGFSWHNMTGQPINPTPRLGGQFFWSQFCAAKSAGATMLYVAMFDEVDEGTAIFKCTNDAPISDESKFLTYEGLPSDHYLRLAGLGARLLRGDIPVSDHPPK